VKKLDTIFVFFLM